MRLAGGRRPEVPHDDLEGALDRLRDDERDAQGARGRPRGQPGRRRDGVPEGMALAARHDVRRVDADADPHAGQPDVRCDARVRPKARLDRAVGVSNVPTIRSAASGSASPPAVRRVSTTDALARSRAGASPLALRLEHRDQTTASRRAYVSSCGPGTSGF